MKFRKLKASEIDARVSTVSEKGCSLLLYKDARVDQNILDETVGPEFWQRSHQLIGNNLYCTVEIFIKELDMWVGKQDVGTESYTEKEKGQASDSFKRACFNWGIGRELYTAPFIWIPADKVNIAEKNGKRTTYDTFTVKDIGYSDEGEIVSLKIVNDKRNQVVFTMGGGLSQKDITTLENLCKRKGLDVSATFPNGIRSLTDEQYAEAVKKLGKLKNKENLINENEALNG